ncbi:MFS transporter [Roseovarius sp. D0-M9]|uniref:MFS transporter n=1 Tax=Roseovarius sp. D0-M9 TaxID=3127117 RepID=UPI00300FE53A
MLSFLKLNFRWLTAGFLLTFTSAFGQTWFISLFAGAIKAEHGLTDGSWGTLYTVATLLSAALMFWSGSFADTVRLARLAPVITCLFALACIGMATAKSVWLLGAALFLLRFCGQGMFSHIAMTAIGRWFETTRGRAVAIVNLGHPASEVIFSILVVLLIAAVGWKPVWLGVAAILIMGIAPFLWVMLRDDRAPKGNASARSIPGLKGLHWQRRDAARHWLLPALLPVLLTPSFITTVVFFHQVHIAETKGWTLTVMAPGYTTFATLTVASALAAGWAADRFGPQRLLTLLLVPMGIGVALISPSEQVWAWYVALGFIGITQGTASALWGVLLPVVYGTRHLGAIRSLAVTIMVISTAIGPGITGVLIDAGVNFPTQSLFMGAWCLMLAAGCFLIDRRLTRELRLI